MSLILLISSLFFFGLSIFILTYNILHTTNSSELLSLSNESEETDKEKDLMSFLKPLVKSLTLQYAIRIKSKTYKEKVEKTILTAGLKQSLSILEFIGYQILLGIFLPITFIIFNFALQIGYPYLASVFISFLVLSILFYIANKKKKNVNIQIIRELPFVTEILALSTEAGLDFIGSIQKITDKYEDTALSLELKNVLQDIKLGSTRQKALKALAQRLDIPEVTSFCAVICDADETGASIAKVLKEQSEQIRLERFVRAEKLGAKASQAILLPMMLFILPSVFIIIFAPVIVQFLST